MSNTKYFDISEGPTAGVFCAYCNKRIKPNGDNLPITYTCDCESAQQEIWLATQLKKATTNLDEHYDNNRDIMIRNELLRKKQYHEESIIELNEQLNILLHQPKAAGDPLVQISDIEQLTPEVFKNLLD